MGLTQNSSGQLMSFYRYSWVAAVVVGVVRNLSIFCPLYVPGRGKDTDTRKGEW